MPPSAGYDEPYVKNSLKTLGIQEGAFSFFNLGIVTRLFAGTGGGYSKKRV
jgi:hypothetical protein